LIRREASAVKLSPEGDRTFLLKQRQIYVFKLQERLASELCRAGFYGQATAKSSVGRVDVLARLVVNGMDQYEGFNPGGEKANYFGDMYLEITPMTFDVKVREGDALSQLRLFYGPPEDSQMSSKQVYETILGEGASDGSLGVDLTPVEISGIQGVAFCARRGEEKDPIPLWKEVNEEKRPAPWDYWKFVPQDQDRPNRLKIEKEQFYLLRSKQKISVPPGIAVYCRASDETIGEMRIHYAGFAHPFFGKRDDGEPGTPLIFEVRGHQINVSLADGERMANLIFYRMSEDCGKPEKGDNPEDPYNTQTLQLSKFFRGWPKPPARLERISDDGIVAPAQ